MDGMVNDAGVSKFTQGSGNCLLQNATGPVLPAPAPPPGQSPHATSDDCHFTLESEISSAHLDLMMLLNYAGKGCLRAAMPPSQGPFYDSDIFKAYRYRIFIGPALHGRF
jgi:hypothetical protein